MFELEYSDAAVEVLDILNNTNVDDVKKIPKEFIQFLVDISSLEYAVDFDHKKKIEEYDLKEKTKELLGYIYIKWWANKEEKQQYLSMVKENNLKVEEEFSKKYDIDKIFKNKVQDNNRIEKNEVQLTEYKESIIKKIINKIKCFFRI